MDAALPRLSRTAASITVAGDDAFAAAPASFGFATQIAMGLALLRARQRALPPIQIAVEDRDIRAVDTPAGTLADIEKWRAAGGTSCIVVPPATLARPAPSTAAPAPDTQRRALAFVYLEPARTAAADMSALASALAASPQPAIRVDADTHHCLGVFEDPAQAARAGIAACRR